MRTRLKDALLRRPWIRPLRTAQLGWKIRRGGQPDWDALLGADREKVAGAAAQARGGPKVLLATSVGGQLAASIIDNLLAAALSLRGAEVHVLLCDAALPACMACEVGWYPDQEHFVRYGPRRDICVHCFGPAAVAFATLGVRVHRYGELLTAEDRGRAAGLAASLAAGGIDGFALDGIPVGEHAMAGALRFFARGDLGSEPSGEPVLRRFLEAAVLAALAVRRLLGREPWTRVVAHHGIYVPQGIVTEVARQLGVPAVTWNPAYRKQTFVFSHGDTYHRALLAEPVASWESVPWTPARQARTLAYLHSRRTGEEDWIRFHDRPRFDMERIARDVGLDPARPWVVLLTSVFWDARLHYPSNAFPDMRDWLLRTIEWFARRPELQLVVRVHPGEVRAYLRARQRAVDEIRGRFPELPANVVVIPPESRISAYAIVARSNAALVYSTKMGVEIASAGVPVITAGEAWVRGKGISIDPRSAAEYFAVLERLPFSAGLDAARTERARRFAYHCFFRRMIPLELVQAAPGWPPYRLEVRRLADLLPGRSRGLDVICAGILDGREFIYPAEEEEAEEAAAEEREAARTAGALAAGA